MSNLLNINGVGQILLRRRALMMANTFPAGYERVKYLSSNRQNYLDTGIIPTTNTIIKCELKPKMVGGYSGLFGAGQEFNTTDNIIVALVYNVGLRGYVGGADNLNILSPVPIDTKLSFEVNVAGFRISDGTNEYYTASGKTTIATGNRSIYINKANTANSLLKNSNAATIFNFKIYNAATLIFNGIPALRKSDNKPGMIDIVTNTFFINQGTGEFGYEKLDGTIVQPIYEQ